MLLSPHELAWCIIEAGFQRVTPVGGFSDAEIMTACSLSESAAQTQRGSGTGLMARTNEGLNVGNWDHGPFMLSGKFHADRIIAAGGNWRDPLVSAKIARQIFLDAGRSFTPWHVFTSSAYKTYLPDARIAVAKPWKPPPDPWTVNR